MPKTPIPDALLAAARTGYLHVLREGPGGGWRLHDVAGAAEGVLGLGRGWVGRRVEEVAPGEDGAALGTMLKVAEGLEGSSGVTRPLRLLHAGGHRVWCVVTAAAVRDAPGGVGLLVRPLDRLELAEEGAAHIAPHLLGQEDFYRRVVDTVHDGILVNDPQGQIIYMNSRMAGLLGYAPQELMGRHLLELMDEAEQRATRARLASRREGVEEVFDCRWRHREGRDVWTQTSAKPLVDARGHHLGSLVALSDITARKAAEAALQELTEALEERVAQRTAELAHEVAVRRAAEEVALAASRSKSAFLANMSHELRTPLNAIIGYVELLMEELEEVEGVDEQTQEDLHRIRRSATHLLELISGILDLSRVEAGHVTLEMSEIVVSSLVQGVAESVAPLVQRRGNQLGVELDPALPVLRSDAVKVRQVLLNGVSNAAKFTERGQITLRAAWDGAAGEVVLTVEDTGEGISAEALGRIFEPFMQEDSSSTRRYEGAGLGLAISRTFAELLGGSLQLQSVKHRGTIFTLRLPQAPPEEASRGGEDTDQGEEAG